MATSPRRRLYQVAKPDTACQPTPPTPARIITTEEAHAAYQQYPCPRYYAHGRGELTPAGVRAAPRFEPWSLRNDERLECLHLPADARECRGVCLQPPARLRK